jgi:hypothetical protein
MLIYLSVRAHDFRSIEQDLALAFSLSLDYPIQEMRIQTVSWSSFVNLYWLSLIISRSIGVHWRCKLVFLFDSLYPPTAWWRAVLLVYQWYASHFDSQGRNLIGESFISNGLGMSSCNHGCSWSHKTKSAVHQWLMFVETRMDAMM